MVNDDSKNRAIVSDTTTKQETTYKVGDLLEDAQLIKILNNKIVFLRSNGQQEVLYLRQKDAQLDPSYALISGWKGITQKITDTNYRLNSSEFTNRVTSVAQFIDLLEITTVYKNGKRFGCRIGKISNDSLGTELGLLPDDIILSVNDIPATETDNRLAIYKKIAAMQTKDTIVVHLLRNKADMTLTYTIAQELPSAAPKAGVKAKPRLRYVKNRLNN